MKLADNHAELRALWSQKERGRADGGWWSLSGFSIQAMVALDRFVRRAVIERAPDAYTFEAVSDFSVLSDKVSLVQVKRTLTRATLAAAVGEARIVLDLCSPTFAQKVEFQIVCEHDRAGLKPSDLLPSEVFEDSKATIIDLNRILARYDPTAPVKVMSHPGLSLRRTLLSAGIRDPDRVARDALGTLFDAFDGRERDGGVERALMRVISGIKANVRNEDVVPGRLLAPDMFEHRVGGSRNLFAGARPRLDELVNGRFLERRAVLQPLVEAVETWLSGLDQSYSDDDLRLPILWLEGRPGDGKSVLTLQLLEHIIVKSARIPSVTELAAACELSAWMTTAARRDKDDQAEIGFIDDLRSRVDKAKLEAMIQDAFYRGSPYVGLITCGTIEDGASFGAGRHVALTHAKINAPSTANLEALRAWAQGRLGRQLPWISPQGVSVSEFMVGLTLEARHQSPTTIGLSANLKAALAVNALGLTAPRSLTDETEMRTYAAEHPDIELSFIEETSGVRLAHAEAIRRLYVDVVGETELAESWGSDLGRVLALRAADTDATEARRLLGSLIKMGQTIRQRRRPGSLAYDTALLDAVYLAFNREGATLQRAPLFRLWYAAIVSQRLTVVDIVTLREEGLQLLIASGNSVDIKAEVAASLILVGPFHDDAACCAAAAFLRRADSVPAAAKYAIKALSKSFQGLAADIAIDWLIQNHQKPEISEVLGCVLNNQAPPKLQELAFAYVRRFIGRRESGAVLVGLAKCHRTKSFYLLQDQWLSQTDDAPRALEIYRDQLQTAYSSHYVGRALAFIQSNRDIRGAQDILALLLRRQSTDPDVLATSRAWLDHYAESALATHVLIELVAIQPLDAGDLARAFRHLDRALPGASVLFATLAAVLQALSPSEQISFRVNLPQIFVSKFDQVLSWKIQSFDGPLKRFSNRYERIQ